MKYTIFVISASSSLLCFASELNLAIQQEKDAEKIRIFRQRTSPEYLNKFKKSETKIFRENGWVCNVTINNKPSVRTLRFWDENNPEKIYITLLKRGHGGSYEQDLTTGEITCIKSAELRKIICHNFPTIAPIIPYNTTTNKTKKQIRALTTSQTTEPTVMYPDSSEHDSQLR